MNPIKFTRAVKVERVASHHWHALEDDRVVGRGEALLRPDGRLFISIDAWHGAAFDRLTDAMLAALPRPLHTVVDEADVELTAQWQRAGFTIRRREWEYDVPTDPRATGLDATPPSGVLVNGFGRVDEARLRALDQTIRAEVQAGPGWPDMPAEVLVVPRLDVSQYAVAVQAGRDVGLLRIAMLTRLPRIGLVAVRADSQRRGVARALLAHTLGALHRVGKEAVTAEVTESNLAAAALFEGIGAQSTANSLELILR